ncbi:MAG: hypothetical protein ACR2QF_03100 [Geminicoccaceae bacterium]
MTVYPSNRNGRAMTEYGHNVALWMWFVLLGVQKNGHWQDDPTNGEAVIKMFSQPAKL